jgi:hypothetical protein
MALNKATTPSAVCRTGHRSLPRRCTVRTPDYSRVSCQRTLGRRIRQFSFSRSGLWATSPVLARNASAVFMTIEPVRSTHDLGVQAPAVFWNGSDWSDIANPTRTTTAAPIAAGINTRNCLCTASLPPRLARSKVRCQYDCQVVCQLHREATQGAQNLINSGCPSNCAIFAGAAVRAAPLTVENPKERWNLPFTKRASLRTTEATLEFLGRPV